MMQFIYSIPDNIGWAMVGFLVALCIVVLSKLVSCIIDNIIENRKEEEE